MSQAQVLITQKRKWLGVGGNAESTHEVGLGVSEVCLRTPPHFGGGLKTSKDTVFVH